MVWLLQISKADSTVCSFFDSSMDNLPLHFVDKLPEKERFFMEHSNEDELNTKSFLEQIPLKFTGKSFSWLDVGTGPGTKRRL